MTSLVTRRAGTLVGRFVLYLCGWSILVVLALTAIGYSAVYDRAERQALDTLQAHLLERGRTESAIFRQAEANMAVFRDRFLNLYTDPAILPDVNFSAYYQRGDDGATRLRPEYFTGTIGADGISRAGISGFIGNSRPDFPPELRRRLVLTYKLVAELGPGWSNRFANTHASLPENALIIYWPQFAWGLEAKADLDMTAFSTLKSTLISENPDRHAIWTPLYHDHTANSWMVTYQLPVDFQGRHLINASHDVLLNDLMDRLITDHLPGSYNFILAPDGHLVAHPLWMDRLRKELATINLEKLGDPGLLRVHALIRDSVIARATRQAPQDPVWIVDDRSDNAYLAVTELAGPGWWFIARYPKSLVAASAHEAARAIMLMGAAYFLAMLVVVFILLRRQVAEPIRQLKAASERLSTGDYALVADGGLPLPTEAKNEIGLLARSFQSMAGHVRDANNRLEGLVTIRTAALDAANQQLRELGLRDPLTGAYNCRAFEADLEGLFDLAARQGKTAFTLVLADIDHFQAYNDAYGEAAGDQVLRTLSRVISRSLGPDDRLYRHHGDGIAIIMTDNDPLQILSRVRQMVDIVAGLALPHQRSPQGIVTLSAGLATYRPDLTQPAALTGLAESRLEEAQRQGRNRLVP